MAVSLVPAFGLLFSGVLAGAELMVRHGVQPALSALPDVPHLQARQALIGRLRVLVPFLMLPTLALGVAATLLGDPAGGVPYRWAGTLALVGFVLVSFLGTVPINIRVYDWNVDAPPDDWRRVIRRWVSIDTVRSSLALLAFALYILALAVG